MTDQYYRELRYPAPDIDNRTPEEAAAIRTAVDAAFVRTFGDDKTSIAETFDAVGYAYRMSIKEHGWDTRTPQDCPAWNARIEKARREIAEHKAECKLRVLASAITDEQILNDIAEIKSWANSLSKVP